MFISFSLWFFRIYGAMVCLRKDDGSSEGTWKTTQAKPLPRKFINYKKCWEFSNIDSHGS